MALDDYRVERTTGGSGNDLTLEARTGESLEILARGIDSAAGNTTVTESVREEDVLAYRADDTDNIGLFPREAVNNQNMDLLMKLGSMGYDVPTVKVPEGHTYTLSPDDSSSNAVVIYREDGPQANSRTDEGGPDNPDRMFIASGEEDSALSSGATAEEFQVTTATTPSPLSGFPYEEDAPQGFEYDLIAVAAGSDDSDGSNTPTVDDFRLETEETSFLARDNGSVNQNHAQYPGDDLTTLPFIFPEPVTIQPGQDLDLFVTKNNGTGTDVQAETAMVFYRRSVR
jgi:hypothetical protein